MAAKREPQGEGPIDDDGTLSDYYARRREQQRNRATSPERGSRDDDR